LLHPTLRGRVARSLDIGLVSFPAWYKCRIGVVPHLDRAARNHDRSRAVMVPCVIDSEILRMDYRLRGQPCGSVEVRSNALDIRIFDPTDPNDGACVISSGLSARLHGV